SAREVLCGLEIFDSCPRTVTAVPAQDGRLTREHQRRDFPVRKKALAAARTQATAQAINAAWKPGITASPLAPSTPPSKAVAIKPPLRANALLKPEAEPVWRSSTAPNTALVS